MYRPGPHLTNLLALALVMGAVSACSEGRITDAGLVRRDSGRHPDDAASGSDTGGGEARDGAAPDAPGPAGDAGPSQADAEVEDLGPTPDAEAGDTGPLGQDAGPLADTGPAADAAEDAGAGTFAVTLIAQVPQDTPAGHPVHVAGSFQSWDPTDPAYAMTPIGANSHSITLQLAAGAYELKFARGDWSRVEKGPGGEELSNRPLAVTGPSTFNFTVARWADDPPGPGTRTGNITEVQVPGFLSGRRVWVYLPPGYASEPAGVLHPVLYMLDGQNVFDAQTSFSGEWQVDEALEGLIPAGEVRSLIVVAVDNGGAARIDEYTPWPGEYQGQPAGGGGQAHLQELITVLKPWVDATYRTLPGPEHTGLSGSSLGGLMSVYAAYAHPDVFGRVGALSPSVWWDEEHLVGFVGAEAKPAVVLWVDMGTNEGDLDPFHNLEAELALDGFVEGVDLMSLEIAGAGHNEAAWAARFPDVLRFLFPGP